MMQTQKDFHHVYIKDLRSDQPLKQDTARYDRVLLSIVVLSPDI